MTELITLAHISITYIGNILTFIIFISSVISWMQPHPKEKIVKFLFNITKPPQNYLRQKFPKLLISTDSGASIDLSPIVLILLIQVSVFLLHKVIYFISNINI